MQIDVVYLVQGHPDTTKLNPAAEVTILQHTNVFYSRSGRHWFEPSKFYSKKHSSVVWEMKCSWASWIWTDDQLRTMQTAPEPFLWSTNVFQPTAITELSCRMHPTSAAPRAAPFQQLPSDWHTAMESEAMKHQKSHCKMAISKTGDPEHMGLLKNYGLLLDCTRSCKAVLLSDSLRVTTWVAIFPLPFVHCFTWSMRLMCCLWGLSPSEHSFTPWG